jgi:N-acetyl-anhydromuramyl-L-alanine amidase AmpD
VRQNGSIYRGRPINAIGAHAEGFNAQSVGICAEGYYHPSNNPKIIPDCEMPEAQKQSLIALVEHCRQFYPKAEIVGHKSLMSTACPGDYYPFDEIKQKVLIFERMLAMFRDVPKSHYAAADIEWAQQKGSVKGNDDGTFGLGQSVKREDMVIMLVRLAKMLGIK